MIHRIVRGSIAALFTCIGCEAQKTLEPVRATGISGSNGTSIHGIASTTATDDVVVKVVDQRGNPMRNATVRWTVTEGAITQSSATNDAGEASARWTFGSTLGQQVATAATGSLTTQITASVTGIWKTVQVSYTGGCGLTTADTPLCWGTNEAGQFANGTPGNPASSLLPRLVQSPQKFDSLKISYAHVCGLTAAGAAYCWGFNNYAQLGVPKASTPICPSAKGPCTSAITAVSGGLTFNSITLGFYHTCGLSKGKAYCWGRNVEGQLGIGSIDTNEHAMPTPVAGGLTFSSLTAGYEYTCGLTAANQAYCWGENAYGEVGIGSRTPVGTPTPVAGNLAFASLWTGSGFVTCGITAVTNLTYCWGLNDSGQLGIGSTDSFSAVPALVAGNVTFAAISPSTTHSCALATSGAAYCWGANADGELGIGATTPNDLCGTSLARCNRTPIAVAGGLTFATLSTNNFNTCGVTSLGGGYCWGLNDNGEFANGTQVLSTVPVPMSNPTGIPLP